MSDARTEVLARVRSALRGSPPRPAPVVRAYRTVGGTSPGSAALVELLVDRLVDYRATVHRARSSDAAGAIHDIVTAEAGAGARIVVAADLPEPWRVGWDAIEDQQQSASELDAFAGTVTTCTVAIAETGTLVLDGGPGQGRRAMTLVPDLHVCLLSPDQVVQTVPEGLARLDPTRPITLISGPSATSDIELQRVEGVHGPRRLHVVILDGA
jgi:L-lactate dehydrogenase complex protein LldG